MVIYSSSSAFHEIAYPNNTLVCMSVGMSGISIKSVFISVCCRFVSLEKTVVRQVGLELDFLVWCVLLFKALDCVSLTRMSHRCRNLQASHLANWNGGLVESHLVCLIERYSALYHLSEYIHTRTKRFWRSYYEFN